MAAWASGGRDRLAALLLAAVVLGSLPFRVHPWFDLENDAALYVLTARSLAAGEGYALNGAPFAIRPPGFSLLLAPIVAATDSFAALNAFVALAGALAAALLFAHARPRLGAPLAALAALAFWANPAVERFGSQVMSDLPGLALVLLGLRVERVAARRRSLGAEAALGLCVGLAAWVRSLALLLVPAIALARVLEARRAAARGGAGATAARAEAGRLAVFAAVALLALAPWAVRNALHPAPAPADQNLIYDYWTGMWHADAGDPASPRLGPGALAERARIVAPALAAGLGSRLQSAEPDPARLAVAALLVAALAAACVRRREPAELFALLSLAALAAYFGFAERLVLPAFALALVAAADTALWLLRPALGARAAALAVGAGLLGLAALDFAPRRHWEEIRVRHEQMAGFCRSVEALVPPGERIGAATGWYYAVYLGRPVYSVIFAVLREGDARRGVERMIEKYDLRALLVSPFLGEEREILPYLRQRYSLWLRAGPGAVVRVRSGEGRGAGASPASSPPAGSSGSA